MSFEIGFLTNCLEHQSLESIIAWAGANGFKSLEVSAWPLKRDPDPNLDVARLDAAQANRLRDLAQQHGISFSCLTYCPNVLHHDPQRRAEIHAHLQKVIEAAELLGVNTVCTFVGRDETLKLKENLYEMQRVFPPILEEAARRGVRIAIENCPMVGWQFEGLAGNIAYSPDIWEEMFHRLPHDNFGLNLDPSHLVWLDVDYLAAMREFASRVFFSHAKDTEIFRDKRARASILDSGGERWWRYRLPGLGEIDWREWVNALQANGYNGPLSIEHEDPVWHGDEHKVKTGLMMAREHLETAQ